jgi:hypothetical protein
VGVLLCSASVKELKCGEGPRRSLRSSRKCASMRLEPDIVGVIADYTEGVDSGTSQSRSAERTGEGQAIGRPRRVVDASKVVAVRSSGASWRAGSRETGGRACDTAPIGACKEPERQCQPSSNPAYKPAGGNFNVPGDTAAAGTAAFRFAIALRAMKFAMSSISKNATDACGYP